MKKPINQYLIIASFAVAVVLYVIWLVIRGSLTATQNIVYLSVFIVILVFCFVLWGMRNKARMKAKQKNDDNPRLR